MYYNVALTTTTTNTLLLVWSHWKLFLQARKARFSYRDSHLYKCLILKASFVSEFSRTGQRHQDTLIFFILYTTPRWVLSSNFYFLITSVYPEDMPYGCALQQINCHDSKYRGSFWVSQIIR